MEHIYQSSICENVQERWIYLFGWISSVWNVGHKLYFSQQKLSNWTCKMFAHFFILFTNCCSLDQGLDLSMAEMLSHHNN